MANPNNNKNFNDEALRINRELKRENDRLKEKIKLLLEIIEEQVNGGH
jgi:hypothetical protein